MKGCCSHLRTVVQSRRFRGDYLAGQTDVLKGADTSGAVVTVTD